MRIWVSIFAGAVAFCTLAGCDDQESGKPQAKSEKHESTVTGLAVARLGPGWQLVSDKRVSVWGVVPVSEAAPPDSLDSIRAALAVSMLPPRNSVQIADLINRTSFDVELPGGAGAGPPGSSILLTETPWNGDTLLLWVEAFPTIPAGARHVTVEFDPRTVAAFRPLGDPSALPIPASGPQRAQMMYELALIQGSTQNRETQYAIVHLPDDPSGSGKQDRPVTGADLVDSIYDAPDAVRFAAAAAEFGELLRGNPAVRDLSCSDVIALAEGTSLPDPNGRRAQLIDLMRRAEPLIDLPRGDATLRSDAN